eukprot:TRINITY_DN27920_c0_g1_i5.p1 TRINITY_DN27920_c0_g1~~TRINITY_DN27920_c0_g1_i5.p1  ORF type:complete len:309 (+),score=130.17 TRINITY_DN27920_c0_g1_i5:67-993(+)
MVRRLQLTIADDGWVTIRGADGRQRQNAWQWLRKPPGLEQTKKDDEAKQLNEKFMKLANKFEMLDKKNDGDYGEKAEKEKSNDKGKRGEVKLDSFLKIVEEKFLELAHKFEVFETKFDGVYAKATEKKGKEKERRREETLEDGLKLLDAKLAELTKKFEQLSVKFDGVFDEKIEENKQKANLPKDDPGYMEDARKVSERLSNIDDMFMNLQESCRMLKANVEDYGKAFTEDMAKMKNTLLTKVEEDKKEILDRQQKIDRQVRTQMSELKAYVGIGKSSGKSSGKGMVSKGDENYYYENFMTMQDYEKF